MKKLTALLLLAALLLAAIIPASAQEAVRIGAMTGPTGIGMAKLMDDTETYEAFVAGSADELTPKILQGELDIVSVPANLASVLYGKTGGGVTVLAVNVLGVLYICEYGTQEIQSLADLKGKTLYATGKGSTPEYFLRYLLTQNGLDPDTDVTIDWQSEPSAVVALLNSQGEGIAMLPQPYVTSAGIQLGESFRSVISLSDEWAALDNGTLCTTAVVLARTAFLEEHPDAAEAFLADFAESVSWVNEHVDEAAELCEKYSVIKAAVAKKAIPSCNLVCITGAEMKEALSGCLSVIYAENPAAVGGSLPGDDFYYGAAE